MLFLARNWWAFLLRGILAILFGLAAILFPTIAFLTLVVVFGVFALVDGIFSIIAAFTSRAKSENWWWLILEGAIGILIGILTIVQPAAMKAAWLFLIAVWALVTGIFEIVTAIRLRKEIEGEFWMILSGVFSVLFGILVFTFPMSGAFAVGFIIGIYALMFGITLVMLAMRLRKHRPVQVAE